MKKCSKIKGFSDWQNPDFSPITSHLQKVGRTRGESGKKSRRKEFPMKKINYKGRCERRKVSKCKDICRTYSKIQSALVDVLEKDDDVISFECNVCLIGVSDNMYSSDFVVKKCIL